MSYLLCTFPDIIDNYYMLCQKKELHLQESSSYDCTLMTEIEFA